MTAEVGKANEEDPVLSSFMSFLSADMKRSPEHIRPFDLSLMTRIAKLVQGVEVTGDEALADEGDDLNGSERLAAVPVCPVRRPGEEVVGKGGPAGG